MLTSTLLKLNIKVSAILFSDTPATKAMNGERDEGTIVTRTRFDWLLL